MTGDKHKWDLRRVEQLRSTMTRAEVDALRARSEVDLSSLSIDEVGVLFLEGRDRIRAIEASARKKGSGSSEPG
jgi:hypothetical protein